MAEWVEFILKKKIFKKLEFFKKFSYNPTADAGRRPFSEYFSKLEVSHSYFKNLPLKSDRMIKVL